MASTTFSILLAANDAPSLEGKCPFNQLLHSFEVRIIQSRFPSFYHRRLILPAPSDLRWL